LVSIWQPGEVADEVNDKVRDKVRDKVCDKVGAWRVGGVAGGILPVSL